MSVCRSGLFALIITSAGVVWADTATQWRGTSDIKFSGTSTLHNWDGKVSAEPFSVIVTMDDQGRPRSLKARVEVTAAKMDTAEKDRDANMRKDMRVTEFPLIIGAFDASFENIARNEVPATLPFKITLLGKPQDVAAKISKWTLKGDTATFDLDFDLSLKKSEITVPSVLFVIRVGDAIHLHASVKLVRAKN